LILAALILAALILTRLLAADLRQALVFMKLFRFAWHYSVPVWRN
jgi:hypothetical protein